MLSPTLIWHGRYDISGNEGLQRNDKMSGAPDVRRKMVYKRSTKAKTWYTEGAY